MSQERAGAVTGARPIHRATTTSATPVDCTRSTRAAGRHFRCEHTYTAPSTIKGYPVTLRVKDDEGNQAAQQLTERIP